MKAEENKEEFEGKSTKNLRKKYRELFTFLYIKITWCAIVTRVHYALIYGDFLKFENYPFLIPYANPLPYSLPFSVNFLA